MRSEPEAVDQPLHLVTYDFRLSANHHQQLPQRQREPTRAHSRERSVLESSPEQASSPTFASNAAAKEAFTRSPSSSRLTAIRMTINDSQHQLERALNQQKQIHTFDTGTVQRCISLRADVGLESTHIHTHK